MARKRRRRKINPVHEEVLKLQEQRNERLQEQADIFLMMGFACSELVIVENEHGIDEVIPALMLTKKRG